MQQDNEEAEGRSVQQPTEEVNEEEGEEQLQDDSISRPVAEDTEHHSTDPVAEETEHLSTDPVAEETEHHATDNVQNQESETKKRKTRGQTKMNKVAKNPEEKVDVEFTRLGEHVGKGSVTLSSFLGPLVREHVPYTLEDWRYLNEQTKFAIWEEIQVLF